MMKNMNDGRCPQGRQLRSSKKRNHSEKEDSILDDHEKNEDDSADVDMNLDDDLTNKEEDENTIENSNKTSESINASSESLNSGTNQFSNGSNESINVENQSSNYDNKLINDANEPTNDPNESIIVDNVTINRLNQSRNGTNVSSNGTNESSNDTNELSNSTNLSSSTENTRTTNVFTFQDSDTERNINVEPLADTLEPLEKTQQAEKIMRRHKEIPLQLLELGTEKLIHQMPTGMKLNKIFIAGMLIRIITPSKEQAQANVMKRFKNQSSSNPMAYRTIYMFRVVSKENAETSNRMFHMIQNSTTNKEIFDRNAVFRDNGVISIGTVLIIVNPDPIENYMNGIPAITTKERVIVAKPMNHPNIPLSNNLEGNDSKAFVYNEAKISLERVTFVDSKCSGNFCDRQRVSEVQHRSKCGCFSIKSNASCIIPIFIIKYTPKNGNCKVIQEFSSLKFFSVLYKRKSFY